MVLQLPGDKARSRKLENLKNEVASLEAAVQAASQEYGRVKQRNLQVRSSMCTACVQSLQEHISSTGYQQHKLLDNSMDTSGSAVCADTSVEQGLHTWVTLIQSAYQVTQCT